MKFFRKLALFMAIGSGALAYCLSVQNPQKVDAVSASDWKAGNIISDSVFTDKNSMSVEQIQEFLNKKVGTGGYDSRPGQCDISGSRNATPFANSTRAQYAASLGRPTTFTCLSNYYEVPKTSPGPGMPANNYGGKPVPAGAKSAAQLIWDAAQAYNISPKVLLVTIEKESAGPLTTDDWPFEKQYVYAMGAHCPDSAEGPKCDPDYAGFSIQIAESAALFRWYLDSMQQPWWEHKRPYQVNHVLWQTKYDGNGNLTNCGGSDVYLETKATAALYTYTPYQPNGAALNNMYGTGDYCSAYGNRNFWRIYNDWFGSTIGTSLAQGSSSTVYLINGDTKYGVPSVEMLKNYGIYGMGITPVSDDYLNSLSDGGVLSTLFNIPNDPTVYLADNGNKYGIPSGEYCTNWALNCSNGVKQINYEIFSKMRSGGTLQALMSNNYVIYKLTNGHKYPYLSATALKSDGHGSSPVTQISSSYNSQQSLGTPIVESDSLIKFGSNPTLYFLYSGKFYKISNFSAYVGWFGNRGAYHDLYSQYSLSPPTESGILTQYFKTSSNNVFLVDNGGKIDITASAANWPTPFSSADLDTIINYLPLRTTDSRDKTYRTPNGAIYHVNDAKKWVVASMTDFYRLGFRENEIVHLYPEALNGIMEGTPLVGEGTIFKRTSSDAIYLKGPDSKVYSLTNMTQLNQYKLHGTAMVLPDAILSTYPENTTLSSFINTDGSISLVDTDSKAWYINSGQESQWGLTAGSSAGKAVITSSNGAIYNSLNLTSKSLPSFASFEGTIFYGENGYKRPITSYQKYLELGGNSGNTFRAPSDFITSSPTGEPI